MNSLQFGKHAPKNDYRTLRLKNYLKAGLPLPSASFNVLDSLKTKFPDFAVSTFFPMDGNDYYRDCTIAAAAHAITIFDGLIGNINIIDTKDVIKLFLQMTGGNNSGLYELDVLNYWQSNSIAENKIIAFVKIDPKNHSHVMQAIELFGGVYLGFQVQQDCLNKFYAKQTWTPGPLTNDGHAVFAVGYDANEVSVLTWGDIQQGTWDWWDECVDEVYAILPPEAENMVFHPGFDFNQLKEDLSNVAD